LVTTEDAHMSATDFIAHLESRGVLRGGHAFEQTALPVADAAGNGGRDDIDWLELTKLTPSAFADELAAFYGCVRVQRGTLLAGQFAGEKMS
jgi:general secretion pathway protein E